jgi:hypothetical protein
MEDIKEKYNQINNQILILKEIKKGDKIYYYDKNMYLQPSNILQSIYRTISRENRELTFKYLESFIGIYTHFVNQTKHIIKYVHDEKIIAIINRLPFLKKQINTILTTLKETYPENEFTLNSLMEFLNSSC